jgi:hypothetical protein
VSRTFIADRFSPQAGDGDILGVQAPSISPHLLPRVLAWASAGEQTTLTLGGSLGLFDRVELGLAVPVSIAQAQVALGDVRVQAKARLFDAGAFSFGASVPVTIPTSTSSGVTVSPRLLTQWSGARRSAVLLDLGAVLRGAGHGFVWSLAGKIDLVPRAELSLRMSVAGEVGPLGVPLEGIAALRWVPIEGLALTLGAGPGLSQDGSARFRVVASIGWVPAGVDRSAHPAQSAAADEALRRVF